MPDNQDADTLPPCPQCACDYSYEDGALLVCPECAHEWSNNPEFSTERIYKDANGNILEDGDWVTLIKDLKVKGTSKVAKVGTKVRIQRLKHDGTPYVCYFTPRHSRWRSGHNGKVLH